MARLYTSLWLLLASATHKELARHVRYLKAENDILRKKLPERITITPPERQRLLKFGEALGKAIHEIVTIVSPSTFLRWIRDKKNHGKDMVPATKRGRKPTPAVIARLVLKLARENGWGLTRILGELEKLGLACISRNTVRNILKRHGFDPSPKRGEGTWDEFLKQHAASLWQCDFFHTKVLTWMGMRNAFVLAFLHVETRRVVLSEPTFTPNQIWAAQQVEAFVSKARSDGLVVRYLQRDRDSKFGQDFDDELKRRRVQVLKCAPQSPNTNAFAERVIQSIKYECLRHFIIFGLKHLSVLCQTYAGYYHEKRPHQGIENRIPGVKCKRGRPKSKPAGRNVDDFKLSDIRCEQRLGGLLKSYRRAA